MTELKSRIRAAWSILCGYAVIRNVRFTSGELEIHGSLHIYGDSAIISSRVWTDAPVIIRATGPFAIVEGNYGDGLLKEEATP